MNFGVALSCIGYVGYKVYKALIHDSDINKVYLCYCSAKSNSLASENCQQTLDNLYKGKGLAPHNTTLFCGPEGSLINQNESKDFYNTLFLFCILTVSFIAFGIFLKSAFLRR